MNIDASIASIIILINTDDKNAKCAIINNWLDRKDTYCVIYVALVIN